MKYTPGEIAKIITTRVVFYTHKPISKSGTIIEWTFEYPNGNITSEVESSFPMFNENHDPEIGKQIVLQKIEKKVWEICGKYTLSTGIKIEANPMEVK